VRVIDLRGSDSVEWHSNFQSAAIGARPLRANAYADNHALFISQAPVVPGAEPHGRRVQPHGPVARGDRGRPQPGPDVDQSRAHTPDGAVDSCHVGTQKITDQALCTAQHPYFGTARTAAGVPITNHILNSWLKPLRRSDYNVTFADEQWERLRSVFPSVACDWNRPGVGEQPSIPWITFEDGPGGRPLGPTPRSVPLGLAAETEGPHAT
jgi:hypothetical protein